MSRRGVGLPGHTERGGAGRAIAANGSQGPRLAQDEVLFAAADEPPAVHQDQGVGVADRVVHDHVLSILLPNQERLAVMGVGGGVAVNGDDLLTVDVISGLHRRHGSAEELDESVPAVELHHEGAIRGVHLDVGVGSEQFGLLGDVGLQGGKEVE